MSLHPTSTFDELFLLYLDEGPGVHLSKNTRTQLERNYRLRIRPHLGDMSLCNLTAETYREYVRLLKSNYSQCTTHSATTLATRLGAYAVQCHALFKNPCFATTYSPRSKPYAHMVYTQDDLVAIMRAASHTPIETLYGLEVCTGLRPSELLALSTDKVLDDGTRLVIDQHLVNYRTRGGFTISKATHNYGRPRTIELPNPAQKYLKRQLAQVDTWQTAEGWVSPYNLIFDDPSRKTLTLSFMIQQNQYIRRLTGLAEFNLQRIRESYCINCLRRGMSHKALQVYLGYWQIDQIMRFYFTAGHPLMEDVPSATNGYYTHLEETSHE